jgi:hypothetical protein
MSRDKKLFKAIGHDEGITWEELTERLLKAQEAQAKPKDTTPQPQSGFDWLSTIVEGGNDDG